MSCWLSFNASQGLCLQVRMSEDSAEHGYFLSALGSFCTRTCYANAGGESAFGAGYVIMLTLIWSHVHVQCRRSSGWVGQQLNQAS